MSQTHKYKKYNKYKYTNTQIQHMMKYQKDPICGIFLKRGLFRGIKNYIPICRTRKYTNTNTKIHKNTNTAYGYQKWYSHVSNMQIHKYKYTNTQIQLRAKLQIDMACAIFMKRYWYEGLKINKILGRKNLSIFILDLCNIVTQKTTGWREYHRVHYLSMSLFPSYTPDMLSQSRCF